MTTSQLIRFNLSLGLMTLLLLLSACNSTPVSSSASSAPLTTHQISSALQQWPTSVQRPFFTTIEAAGRRTTATGLLDYHSPRDFRLTTITETGNVLFDVTRNWAGITVHRTTLGLDPSVVSTIAQDVGQIFRFPESFDALQLTTQQATLRDTSAQQNVFTYTFLPPEGRLTQTQVRYSFFDSLSIAISRYDSRGWPQELTLSRPARLYTIHLSFTDSPLSPPAPPAPLSPPPQSLTHSPNESMNR